MRQNGAVLGYLGRLGVDGFLTEDITQETFLRAWPNEASVVNAGAAARGWLFTVFKNIMIDRARSCGVWPEKLVDMNAYQSTGDDLAVLVVERAATQSALARLSPAYCAVLIEVYCGGVPSTKLLRRSMFDQGPYVPAPSTRCVRCVHTWAIPRWDASTSLNVVHEQALQRFVDGQVLSLLAGRQARRSPVGIRVATDGGLGCAV